MLRPRHKIINKSEKTEGKAEILINFPFHLACRLLLVPFRLHLTIFYRNKSNNIILSNRHHIISKSIIKGSSRAAWKSFLTFYSHRIDLTTLSLQSPNSRKRSLSSTSLFHPLLAPQSPSKIKTFCSRAPLQTNWPFWVCDPTAIHKSRITPASLLLTPIQFCRVSRKLTRSRTINWKIWDWRWTKTATMWRVHTRVSLLSTIRTTCTKAFYRRMVTVSSNTQNLNTCHQTIFISSTSHK